MNAPSVGTAGLSLSGARRRADVLQVSVSQQHWARPPSRLLRTTLDHIAVAADQGSDVILFPEANLTGYDFAQVIQLTPAQIEAGLAKVRDAARAHRIYVICGTIQRRSGGEKLLNLAHVVDPAGEIIHEYAKIQMAGEDEQRHCRPGNKLSLFQVKGFWATLVICRDGRHPELYRYPVMAGARIVFHPACSTDNVESVWWKRAAGRATQAAGPNSFVFHCCANTVGQDHEGRQTSSGGSFIKHPTGLSLAEADWYSEMVITARLDMRAATGRYALASAEQPAFLRPYYEQIIREVHARKDERPE